MADSVGFEFSFEDVGELVKTNMEKLKVIWKEYYNVTSIQKRCETVKKDVQTLFDGILEDEKEKMSICIRKMEQYLEEISTLSKAVNMKINLRDLEHWPLCEAESELRLIVEELRKIKEAGDEEQRMMQEYQKSRSAILAIMAELKIEPTLDMEELVCQVDTAFTPTKENMNALRQLHQRLELQLQDAKDEVTELHEKLLQLWDYLHEDYSHRELFLAAHQGLSAGTLKALMDEIKRCEELKCLNIKQSVEDFRKQLTCLWDKCLVGEEERSKFLPHSPERFTEDLLKQHALEVQNWHCYYKQNSVILKLTTQHHELCHKMLELKSRTSDPNRLFQNRGGRLLLEEKESQNIQKELPKVERELIKHIRLYEQQNNTPFKIYGVSVDKIMGDQWALRRDDKEQERKAKKLAKECLLKVKSGMRSQSQILKQKNIPVNPCSADKLREVTVSENTATSENHPPATQRTVVSGNILAEPESHSSADENVTTYRDLQDHLEVLNLEGTCRTSVVPGHCLRERNVFARIPSKIPLKILEPRMLNALQTPETPKKPTWKYAAGQKPSKQPGANSELLGAHQAAQCSREVQSQHPG